MQEYQENQTIFSVEEPYHLASKKKKKISDNQTVKKPPLLVFVGIAVGGLLIATLLVAGMFRNRNKLPPITTEVPTPTMTSQSTSEIDEMMIELRNAVDEADPAKTSLPFPPVADRIKVAQ